MAGTLMARRRPRISAAAALDAAVRSWWLVTAAGQWLFTAYVAGLYGPLLALDGVAGLRQAPLFNGYLPGDVAGNLAVAGHIVLATIILGGGSLQLLPALRARAPAFHRWLGRIYVLASATSAAAGIALIWTRPLFGPVITNVATSLDGVLIIVFATLAWRRAIARDIPAHRRWALRLFMAASSVWFLRIGFQSWQFLTGGIGVDFDTFSGPFLVAWHFGQYLLPLGLLELYLRARERGDARAKWAMALVLVAFTAMMGIGVVRATLDSWLPKLIGT